MIRSKIVISKHAMERLSQRLPTLHKNQYIQYVSNARYLGATASTLPNELIHYTKQIMKTKNTVVRIYKDCVFIFRGTNKAHILITVFPLKERFLK